MRFFSNRYSDPIRSIQAARPIPVHDWLLFAFLLLALFQPAQAAPPQLKIKGSAITNASSGCTVRLRGVNVDGLEYGVNDGDPNGILATVSAAITTWKSNFIRLPLSQDRWFFYPYSYRSMVDQLVNLCSQNNCYIILDLHWSGTSSTATTPPYGAGWGTATGQQEMPDANSVTFWSSVAARYANNPAVFFDLYNEPFGVSASVWYNGGSAGFTTPGMNKLLSTVRATGANNICIAGGLAYCNDLSQILPSFALTDTGSGNGVLYSAHIYSNNANQTVNVSTATYPVMVGEFGPCATCGATAFTQNFMNYLDSNNLSWTAWNMAVTVNPPLLSSWSGYSPTSYHGQYVYNSLTGTANPSCDASLGGPTYTPTPIPTQGSCFMLSNFSTSATYPSASCPSTLAFNSMDGKWFTFDWTTTSTSNGVQTSPAHSYVTCPAPNDACPAILSNAVAGPGGETYSAFVSGGYDTNGTSASPVTYAGFGLATEMTAGNTNLNWVTNYSFYVRTTVAPVTLRFQASNPYIDQTAVTWNGTAFAGGGNGNQYGQNFVVKQANTWILESIPANGMEFQDWCGGAGACPPTNGSTTYTQSMALSQVISLQWETQGGPTTLGISINDVCLSGTSIPPTATPSMICSNPTNTPTFTPSPSPTLTFTKTFSPTTTNSPTGTPTATSTKTNTLTPTNTVANTATFTPTSTRTPTFTNTGTFTATRTATSTATSTPTIASTNTFTNSPTRTFTPTFTNTWTNTPANTATNTGTSTATSSPTNSQTRTFTPTYTNSPTATATNTLASTATNTGTSTFTFTNSPTRTSTSTSTFTSTPTNTPSRTPSATPTVTMSPTNTNVITPTPTGTPTVTSTYTFTLTSSPSSTPTRTSTATSTSTNSFTATPSNTPANTLTPTMTASSTPTKTNTPTSTSTNTATITPTPTNTNVITPTLTSTGTKTATATFSSTATFTNTLVNTATSTATGTPTNTLGNTATASMTPTASLTASATPSPTATRTSTAANTATNSPTNTLTRSFTPTLTPTFTNTPTFTHTPTATPTQPQVNVTLGGSSPANSNQIPGASNVPVLQFTLSNTTGDPLNLTNVKLTASGTGNDAAAITSAQVYGDANGDGIVDGGDPLLSTGGYTVDNGTVVLTLSDTLGASATKNYLVVYNFAGAAVPGTTFQTAINNVAADLSGTDAVNGRTISFVPSGSPTITSATVHIVAATPTPTLTFTSTPTFTSTLTQTPTVTPTATLTPKPGNDAVIYPNPSTGGPVNVMPAVYTGSSAITVEIFTTAFRKVLSNDYPPQAYGPVKVNMTDTWGTPLASGLYYVVVTTDQGRSVAKLLLLR